MKKLLLSAVFALSVFCSQAQTGLSLGIKFGGNYSTISGADAPEGSTYKLGTHAGALVEYAFTSNFSIRPEFLYSTKGVTVKFMAPDFESIDWNNVDWEAYEQDPDGYDFGVGEKEHKVIESLHYIDIPVLAQYKVGPIFLQAGPTAAIFLSSKTEMDGMAPDEEETAGDNEYRAIDLGYALGAGYQFSNGLEISGRFNKSFTNIDKNNNYKAKNMVFQLSLAYRVPVK